MITALLDIWWLWVAAALIFAVIEVLAPGFIFLGFALGALATAGVVAFWPLSSAPLLLALFSGISLLAWVALRAVFKRQSSDAKIITRDINDN
ncbi:NfeD family protein [Roseobacter weihaiensis]|uniref:NfeD family protein n=1 Tax=Roseobacter weihaiensis TaxID=2763262 RepID=UPI001D0AD3ED|nr:hypothetical protein [Roseobacter sp. H9]